MPGQAGPAVRCPGYRKATVGLPGFQTLRCAAFAPWLDDSPGLVAKAAESSFLHPHAAGPKLVGVRVLLRLARRISTLDLAILVGVIMPWGFQTSLRRPQ